MKHGASSFLRVVMSVLALGMLHDTQAQIAKGATKFLGNITTRDNSYLDEVKSDFGQYWNQITAENVCKWGMIEGNTQGQKNFARCDSVYKYARRTGIPFKFHTLVWGSQYPGWMDKLSRDKQLEAITNWMDSVAAHYPDADLIDVVNEPYHAHPKTWSSALGDTSFANPAWIAKAFQMARARWPKAKLVLNDYNNFRWDVDNFIAIAKAVKVAGPGNIDAIGCQAHDLSAAAPSSGYTFPEMSAADLSGVLKKLHDETGLPIYVSELDLSYEDDAAQLNGYKSLFPVLWESEYVAGVTIWGYIYGKTWDQAKFSGLIKNDVDRPAFTWLKQYVKDNPNPKTPAAVISRSSARGASIGNNLLVRSIGGRLVLGVERKDGFRPVGPLGRN